MLLLLKSNREVIWSARMEFDFDWLTFNLNLCLVHLKTPRERLCVTLYTGNKIFFFTTQSFSCKLLRRQHRLARVLPLCDRGRRLHQTKTVISQTFFCRCATFRCRCGISHKPVQANWCSFNAVRTNRERSIWNSLLWPNKMNFVYEMKCHFLSLW